MTATCCDLHAVTCDLLGEACCPACPELGHPAHADGSPCVLTVPVLTARQMAEALIREFGQRVSYTDIWVRLPHGMENGERTRLALEVEELIGGATVTIALSEAPPSDGPVELGYDLVVALDAAPRGDVVQGWVVVGWCTAPDLTNNHLVIGDMRGRFFAVLSAAWSGVERGGRVAGVPVCRRPKVLDVTGYEFVSVTP